MKNPFHYVNCSPAIIRLTVMMFIRYPLSLRHVENLLFERSVNKGHETVHDRLGSKTVLRRHPQT
jgi:putative transposase